MEGTHFTCFTSATVQMLTQKEERSVEVCDATGLMKLTEGDVCRVDGFSSHWSPPAFQREREREREREGARARERVREKRETGRWIEGMTERSIDGVTERETERGREGMRETERRRKLCRVSSGLCETCAKHHTLSLYVKYRPV